MSEAWTPQRVEPSSGMIDMFKFSSRSTPDRDLDLPVYRALIVSLFQGAARNAANVFAYALFAGFMIVRAGDPAIKASGALLMLASFLRIAIEMSCRGQVGGEGARLRTAEAVERSERRYIVANGLFALALSLVQWCVLVLPGGEPFRLITQAGVLVFLISAPGRACGSPRAVALQTTLINASFCAAMLTTGGETAYFAILLSLAVFRHQRDSTRALHQTMLTMLLAQRAAEDLANRFDTALNNMARGLVMLDRDGRVRVANRIFATMFRLTAPAGERRVADVIAESIAPMLNADENAEAMAAFFAGEDGAERQARLADGRILAFSRQPMPQGSVITVADVTAEYETEQNIQRMARFDPVTGLPNRAHFAERLAAAIAAAGADGFSLLAVDLDRFKEVNDAYGHHVGDLLLAEAAARMRAVVDRRGLVARFGGDEFMVLLDAAQRSAIGQICAGLVRAVSAPYELEGKSVRIGASLGAALFPENAPDRKAATLLQAADMALYDAKGSGRGAVKFFVEDMALAVRRRRQLGVALRDALGHGQLTLAYQPIVDIRTRRVMAVEALLRWTHPKFGAVSPSEFIPIAEETGTIVEIGAFVLNRACRDATNWPAPVRVAVNLSALQFERGDLEATVRRALADSGLPAERLELEITETILIGNHAEVMAKLNRLTALGAQIALDDFGTGYSSLSYLNDFTFNKVKVDQSFVRDMTLVGNSKAASIIRAVNAIGADLNMTVVAEGVESAEQLQALSALGVDGAQGYYFSAPAPAEEIGVLLLKELAGQGTPPDPARRRTA